MGTRKKRVLQYDQRMQRHTHPQLPVEFSLIIIVICFIRFMLFLFIFKPTVL